MKPAWSRELSHATEITTRSADGRDVVIRSHSAAINVCSSNAKFIILVHKPTEHSFLTFDWMSRTVFVIEGKTEILFHL